MKTENIIVLIINLLLGQISESSNKIMEQLRKYDDENDINKDVSMVLFIYSDQPKSVNCDSF